MVNAFVEVIKDAFTDVFLGGTAADGLLILLFLITFIAVLLFMMRMPKAGIIIVILPLILVVSKYGGGQFLAIPIWIPIIAFVIMGAVFYAVFALLMR